LLLNNDIVFIDLLGNIIGDAMKSEVQSLLAELKVQFARLYGKRLQQISLFGSQARGDSMPGSDIDVLVVLSGEVSPAREIEVSGDLTSTLSLEHDVVLSCIFMSADRFEKEQSPLLLNIRREGIPV
jgi:predicted nucleotidyltransferase